MTYLEDTVALIDTLLDENGLATASGQTESEEADPGIDEPQYRRKKLVPPARTAKKVKHEVNKTPLRRRVKKKSQRPGGCDLHLQWALIAMSLVEVFTVARKSASVTRTGGGPAILIEIANQGGTPTATVLTEMPTETETEIEIETGNGNGNGHGFVIEKLATTDLIVRTKVEMSSVIVATENENEIKTATATATETETETGAGTDVGTEAEKETATAIEKSIATENAAGNAIGIVTETGTDGTEVLDEEMMIDGMIEETIDETETEVTLGEIVSQCRLIDMSRDDSYRRLLFESVATWRYELSHSAQSHCSCQYWSIWCPIRLQQGSLVCRMQAYFISVLSIVDFGIRPWSQVWR